MKFLKIKNGFQIKNGLESKNEATNGNRSIIFLYGVVGWDIDVNQLNYELSKLPEGTEEIDFYLHSPGGLVYEGLALLTTLARLKKDYYTRMYIDGIAASMGSAIALEAHETHASITSEMMIHNAWMWLDVYGGFNVKEIDDLIEELKNIQEGLNADDDVLSAYYAKKTGMSIEDVKSKFMDGKDHFLAPAKMLEYGFIDSIIDTEMPKPDLIEEEEESEWLSNAKIKYKSVASSIKTPYKGIEEKKLNTFAFGKNQKYNRTTNFEQNSDIMKNKLALILGLDPNASDEVFSNAVNALKNDLDKMNKKNQDQQKLIDDYKTSTAKYESDLKEIKDQVLKTKAENLVKEIKEAAESNGMIVNKKINDSLNDLAVNYLNAVEEGDEVAAKNFREHMELKAKANLIPIGDDPSYKSKDDRSDDSQGSLTKEKLEKTRNAAIAKAKAAKQRKNKG